MAPDETCVDCLRSKCNIGRYVYWIRDHNIFKSYYREFSYPSTTIRLCHTAAILSRETKKALFYHAEPRSQNRGGEALRGQTKLFWSPGTIWPPCDKGEYLLAC